MYINSSFKLFKHNCVQVRALDKQEYLVIIRDNFCLVYIKTYVVTPHLNRLIETVQMRGHNICFRSKIRKIIIKYSLLSRALQVHQILYPVPCKKKISSKTLDLSIHYTCKSTVKEYYTTMKISNFSLES